jgi:outer membrane receptor protein involved in Fe transport
VPLRWKQAFFRSLLDGNSIASLLLGYPANGQVDWQDNPYRTRPYLAGYIQDDWKISRTVSLNIGLRYEVQVPWSASVAPIAVSI